jgi:hypothetical protein
MLVIQNADFFKWILDHKIFNVTTWSRVRFEKLITVKVFNTSLYEDEVHYSVHNSEH